MNALLAIVACIVGAFFWLLTFILFKDGAGPIGGADFLTWVVFLAPFGFFGPFMARLSHQKNELAVFWLLALFPLLSIAINIVFVMLVISIFDSFRLSLPMPDWLSKEAVLIVVALVFWGAIAAGLIKSGWTSPKEVSKMA